MRYEAKDKGISVTNLDANSSGRQTRMDGDYLKYTKINDFWSPVKLRKIKLKSLSLKINIMYPKWVMN